MNADKTIILRNNTYIIVSSTWN